MSGILMGFVGGTYGRTPDAPTIGTASYVDRNTASVTYTAPGDTGGAAITSYTATASPGGVSATVYTSASGSITVPGLSPYIPYTFTVRATSIIGTGAASAASNSVTLYGPGQVEYTTAGTYYWTAPLNVTSVCVVAVGGGGSGANNSTTGGGGGGLGWKNNISVTPGQTYLVQVGYGASDPAFSNGTDPQANIGGSSYFINTSTVYGEGGFGGAYGSRGGSWAGDGGGSGGGGGVYPGYVSSASGWPGGGGAGGYTGSGGIGGNGGSYYVSGYTNADSGTAGSGGGGGGGGGSSYQNVSGSNAAEIRCNIGSGGGGVGIYGQGASGGGGQRSLVAWEYIPPQDGGPLFVNGTVVQYQFGGGGGSSGTQGGVNVTSYYPNPITAASVPGGLYGGGAGRAVSFNTNFTAIGGGGAVRIIWGTGRAFPSTNTGNV
jgi:hypothetical protein